MSAHLKMNETLEELIGSKDVFLFPFIENINVMIRNIFEDQKEDDQQINTDYCYYRDVLRRRMNQILIAQEDFVTRNLEKINPLERDVLHLNIQRCLAQCQLMGSNENESEK